MNVHLHEGRLSTCQHPLRTHKFINRTLLLFPKWDLNQGLAHSSSVPQTLCMRLLMEGLAAVKGSEPLPVGWY